MPKNEVKPLFDGPRLDGVRVLVVEDDPDSREMLCELLHLFGAECWAVADVPSARVKLAEFVPDVILSDIGLPGEDGYALLRWVQARPTPPPAPSVIAVTAFDGVSAIHAAGFDAYIPKPVAIPRLLRAIVDVANKRTSRPEGRLP